MPFGYKIAELAWPEFKSADSGLKAEFKISRQKFPDACGMLVRVPKNSCLSLRIACALVQKQKQNKKTKHFRTSAVPGAALHLHFSRNRVCGKFESFIYAANGSTHSGQSGIYNSDSKDVIERDH